MSHASFFTKSNKLLYTTQRDFEILIYIFHFLFMIFRISLLLFPVLKLD